MAKTISKTVKSEFARFEAMPNHLRKQEFGYDTDFEFAKNHKIDRHTVSNWRKEDWFSQEIKSITKSWGKDKIPNVLMGLYRKCVKEGNAAEVKLWLQIFDNFTENGKEESPAMKKLAEALIKLAEPNDDSRRAITGEG